MAHEMQGNVASTPVIVRNSTRTYKFESYQIPSQGQSAAAPKVRKKSEEPGFETSPHRLFLALDTGLVVSI